MPWPNAGAVETEFMSRGALPRIQLCAMPAERHGMLRG